MRTWAVPATIAVAGATALLAADHARAWHFFDESARSLFGIGDEPGLGWALYRERPDLQFGPIMAVLSAPFVVLPGASEEWLVMVAASLAVVGVLAAIRTVARTVSPIVAPDPRIWPVAGGALALLWLRLSAFTTHVDDVVVLVCVASAAAQMTRQRSGTATLLLAIAAAAKPWGLAFAPLAALGGGTRAWLRPLLVACGAGATWLPFVLGAPGTLDALRSFTLGVQPNSGLVALGVDGPAMPGWVRPAQLVLALAVTSLVVWRGYWPAFLAAGVAARMALDPADFHYYNVGLVTGALLWESSLRPNRPPWCTLAAAVVLEAASAGITLGGAMPYLRLGVLTLAMCGGFWGGRPRIHRRAEAGSSTCATGCATSHR